VWADVRLCSALADEAKLRPPNWHMPEWLALLLDREGPLRPGVLGRRTATRLQGPIA
jgi:hypothetical protein